MPGPLKRPHFKWAGAASSCLRGALALTPRGTLRCGFVSPTSGSPAFLLPFLDSIKTWPSVIIPYLRWYGQGQVLESESTELGTRQRELASELSPSVPRPPPSASLYSALFHQSNTLFSFSAVCCPVRSNLGCTGNTHQWWGRARPQDLRDS